MIKHVGRQGDKKVVVVFREVPGEEHMALVVYPDQLQQNLHDDLMNAIQSAKGQAAKDLGDAIHGITGTNGQTILNTLHNERFMKKIRTQDIIMIPQPNNPGVRLDELNKIILSPMPSIGFEYLFDTGLLKLIFPEMVDLYGVETRNNLSHKDNFVKDI